jgi:hypothetical protein
MYNQIILPDRIIFDEVSPNTNQQSVSRVMIQQNLPVIYEEHNNRIYRNIENIPFREFKQLVKHRIRNNRREYLHTELTDNDIKLYKGITIPLTDNDNKLMSIILKKKFTSIITNRSDLIVGKYYAYIKITDYINIWIGKLKHVCGNNNNMLHFRRLYILMRFTEIDTQHIFYKASKEHNNTYITFSNIICYKLHDN